MPPLTLAVGQPADRQQIRAVEKVQSVCQIEPDTGVEFLGDAGQPSGPHARRDGRGAG